MPTYRIKQGKNDSGGIHFRVAIKRRMMDRLVRFNDSCLVPWRDVNPLCGWGHVDKDANSIQFGWKSDGSRIELVSLMHLGPFYFGHQQHQIEIFGSGLFVEMNRIYQLHISTQIVHGWLEYYLAVIDPDTDIILGFKKFQRPSLSMVQYNIGRIIHPRLADHRVAPHDITIELEEI